MRLCSCGFLSPESNNYFPVQPTGETFYHALIEVGVRLPAPHVIGHSPLRYHWCSRHLSASHLPPQPMRWDLNESNETQWSEVAESSGAFKRAQRLSGSSLRITLISLSSRVLLRLYIFPSSLACRMLTATRDVSADGCLFSHTAIWRRKFKDVNVCKLLLRGKYRRMSALFQKETKELCGFWFSTKSLTLTNANYLLFCFRGHMSASFRFLQSYRW